jgi:hypothetical protein
MNKAQLKKFKGHLVDQICQASGGPCKYTGKSMKEAHKGMGVSGADFNALVEDLVGALDKFKVDEKSKNDLLGALGPMKSDIVEKTGFAALIGWLHAAFVWQTAENPDTLAYLGQEGEPRGVIVIEVQTNKVSSLIMRRDILLEIDGFSIDVQGDYKDPDYGKLSHRKPGDEEGEKEAEEQDRKKRAHEMAPAISLGMNRTNRIAHSSPSITRAAFPQPGHSRVAMGMPCKAPSQYFGGPL